ncbi:MAG: hypothetical protein JRI54_00105 [Deltaproteobacteria bacterium]|nr:hypothetical protein [Deltaproteobacteria bacterium]
MFKNLQELTGQESGFIDGIDINVYADYNGELPASGTIYRLDEDTVVVAPDDWC